MTEVHVIAAIARNGVIGRTTKPCAVCGGLGAFHGIECEMCDGAGILPANDTPWSYPEDMKHFRDATMGHAVVMGRRTWESLPEQHRPLKGRKNSVVSATMLDEHFPFNALRHETLEDAIYAFRVSKFEKVFVIGGAQLYAAALPPATHLDLTLIGKEYPGDVKFPGGELFANADAVASAHVGGPSDPSSWWFECIDRRQGTTPELTFTRWVRK